METRIRLSEQEQEHIRAFMRYRLDSRHCPDCGESHEGLGCSCVVDDTSEPLANRNPYEFDQMPWGEHSTFNIVELEPTDDDVSLDSLSGLDYDSDSIEALLLDDSPWADENEAHAEMEYLARRCGVDLNRLDGAA